MYAEAVEFAILLPRQVISNAKSGPDWPKANNATDLETDGAKALSTS